MRETKIIEAQEPPHGVFVCDHADVVINEFSLRVLDQNLVKTAVSKDNERNGERKCRRKRLEESVLPEPASRFGVCAGVPRSYETAPSQYPTVGLCIGPYGSPGG